MTIYFVGGELEQFDQPLESLTDIISSTNAAHFDAIYSRTAVQICLGFRLIKTFTPLTEGWVHAFIYSSGSSNNDEADAFFIANGTLKAFGLRFDSTPTPDELSIMKYDGSVLVKVGSVAVNTPGTVEIDIQFKIHDTTGIFRVYRNGALVYEFLGDTLVTGYTSFNRLYLQSPYTGGTNSSGWAYSQVMISSNNTVGTKLKTLVPTANGTHTDWTGVFTDVDETGIAGVDNITSTVAGDIETYALGDIGTEGDPYNVAAVVTGYTASVQPTGPQNINPVLRVTATNYFQTALAGLDGSLKGYGSIYELSPATGIAWTKVEVNGMELGVRSAA